MKRLLLVDGYNVIHKIPSLRSRLDRSLESARDGLRDVVSSWLQKHPDHEGLIVFDGVDPVEGEGNGRRDVSGRIASIFTRSRVDADDEIIRRVRECGGDPSRITVVTDDNYVRNNCRAHGAYVEPSHYLPVSQKRNPPRKGEDPADEKALDHEAIAQINRDVKKKLGLGGN
ncbi:MAG: NYN domain-containing protein [Candidatus Omnitrophica bacterium]|nr:NYN domain-containing protein [Candidatus Omnitrophota bacterium]